MYKIQQEVYSGIPIISIWDIIGEDDDGDSRDPEQFIENPRSINPLEYLEKMKADDELADATSEALSALPRTERAAIRLYYYTDFNERQVGALLGVTESRACQLIGKGVERLRCKLSEYKS